MRWSPLAMFDSKDLSANYLNPNIANAVHQAAESIGMVSTNSGIWKPYRQKPWFDAECRAMKRHLTELHNACRSLNFACLSNNVEFHQLRVIYQKLISDKKKNYRKKITNDFAAVTDTTKFWAVVRSVKRITIYTPPLPIQAWNDFYANIYPSRIVPELSLFPDNESIEIEQPFTFDEVKNCLRKLKNGKAPGCDEISNEFLKNLPTNWILYIQAMFNRILDVGETPDCWSKVVLTMLHKKGDASDPNNFRGIALVNCLTKVFTQLINQRLTTWATNNKLIPEEQAGFLKGRGCQDNVFILNAAL